MSYRLLLKGQSLHNSNLPLSNCTIYCKGPMTPSPLRLRVMATRLGARCVFKMSPAVTHVIVDLTKIAQLSTTNDNVHIVHPQWIIDCFHTHKCLDERTYLITNNCLQQQQQRQQLPVETTRFNQIDNEESASITRLHAIEMLLNERLPSSPEAFLDKMNYYQYTREGRMLAVKSLLRWRFLRPKQRLTEHSYEKISSIKHKNGDNKASYTTTITDKKKQLTQRISSWKLEMTDYLLTHPPTGPTPIHEKNKYTFCHIHIDSFFILSSLNTLPSDENASLIGEPVIVITGQSTNSDKNNNAIIIDCTATAKQMGIESGMLVKEALDICPNISMLLCATEVYSSKGQKLFEILGHLSAHIMPLNYNEAILDLSGHVSLSTIANNNFLEFGSKLQKDITKEIDLYSKIGFGDSILTAQIATKLAGTNGIFSVTSSTCSTLLINRPLSFLPGVSSEIENQFAEQLGITKCGEIISTPVTDICRVIGVLQAKQLTSIMKGQIDDAAKGFFPVKMQVNQSKNQKMFLNTLESRQIHKQSTESLSSKALKRFTIATKNITGPLHSLQGEEYFDRAIAPLITELYLRMLRNGFSLTSETQLIITIQIKQSTCSPHTDQDKPYTDHYSVSATTEIFNTIASSTQKQDYQELKSAARRCIKDLWNQTKHNLSINTINCLSNKVNNENKTAHIFKSVSIQQEVSSIVHEISLTLSYLSMNAGVVVDDNEYSHQEISNINDLSDNTFKEWHEPEKPLITELTRHKESTNNSTASIYPLTHYSRAYSIPSRAYEHSCLFSTDVKTRIKDYQSALDAILSRSVPEDSNETRHRLLHTALHSFVVQLCYDGDLEGVLYLFKKYQFTKETCEYVNTRFVAKII